MSGKVIVTGEVVFVDGKMLRMVPSPEPTPMRLLVADFTGDDAEPDSQGDTDAWMAWLERQKTAKESR